jgi:hypothetical protein
LPPNQCVMQNAVSATAGTAKDTAFYALCREPANPRTIKWKEIESAAIEYDISSMQAVFECEACTGGFAYSSNYQAYDKLVMESINQ